MMYLDPTSTCFDGMQYVPSPNQDLRPKDIEIDLLVIHNISLPPNELVDKQYIIDFFCNQLDSSLHPFFEEIQSLKVSCHICIFRDGSAIQFVPLQNRAWHAGLSRHGYRTRCNDFSIGIELQGCDDRRFTPAQYQALIEITKKIQNQYPGITTENIVGHSDISPGRKTDPGPKFDWGYYLGEISQ